MRAEPDVQLRLLDLQAVDARLDKIAYQRRTLPQHQQVAELERRAGGLRDRIVAGQAETSDLRRAQTKADLDVEQVRARASRDQGLLDSGRITASKELESLQHELASLARRQGELEDIELEIMEKLEAATASLGSLTRELAGLDSELATVTATRDDQLADLDGDGALASGERERLRVGLPADLLGLYEKLRVDHNGVGAAALRQRRCEGCRIELTPVDIARIREAAPDEVLRCEECRRLLVRTPESGL
ncbi:MAG: C4-type zinc ribbon domain-containing protein [Candidatus Nanopelagicales bacterium]